MNKIIEDQHCWSFSMVFDIDKYIYLYVDFYNDIYYNRYIS